MAQRTSGGRDGFWSARVILSIILVAASLLFIFSNLHVVPVGFFGIELRLPMWIWFALLLAIGIGIGWLRPWSWKH